MLLVSQAIVGIITGGAYFFGRDNVLRIISKDSEMHLFWIVEIIYILCGSIFLLYSVKQLREERELNNIR